MPSSSPPSPSCQSLSSIVLFTGLPVTPLPWFRGRVTSLVCLGLTPLCQAPLPPTPTSRQSAVSRAVPPADSSPPAAAPPQSGSNGAAGRPPTPHYRHAPHRVEQARRARRPPPHSEAHLACRAPLEAHVHGAVARALGHVAVTRARPKTRRKWAR